MEEKEIREIFKFVFNGLPNPIFKYPIKWFQVNDYLCEVASADTVRSLRYNRLIRSPLNVFDGLFIDDGFWITVLRKNNDGYEHDSNLSGHISSLEEIESFIKEKLT